MLARPLWILAVCALIVTLRLGRGALIPVALAVLIALVEHIVEPIFLGRRSGACPAWYLRCR